MIRVLLQGGDTMLGRGVQLTLPFQSPNEVLLCDSTTVENYLTLALHRTKHHRLYPLPEEELRTLRQWNQDGSYLWGDYVRNLRIHPPPDLRLLNLEAAVTESVANRDVPHKYIKYHLHASNVPLVFKSMAETTFTGETPTSDSAIRYVISFANNHAMDFGRTAFECESLPAFASLPGKGYVVGVGVDADHAKEAGRVCLSSLQGDEPRRAVSVIAVTTECAGTPFTWAAGVHQPGMLCLPAIISAQAVAHSVDALSQILHANGLHPSARCHNDVVILSIHWGPNWAYQASTQRGDLDFQSYRQQLAHRVIRELGIDLIYGHSSHHIRGLEVYDGKLIVYGAGDLINDYEGFGNTGEEPYNELGGLFVVDVRESDGKLAALRLIPMIMDRLQLRRVDTDGSFHRWNPRHESIVETQHAVTSLCNDINKLSMLDAGDRGRGLRLRVVHDDVQVPGGPCSCIHKTL